MTSVLIGSAAIGIAYSLVCRAAKMDESTYHEIRVAFALQATSALAVVLFMAVKPDWTQYAVAAFFGSVLWVQRVTARHWANGQPNNFIKRG